AAQVALGLFHLAFGLEVAIAGDLTGFLLDSAGRLLQATLHPLLIHHHSPRFRSLKPNRAKLCPVPTGRFTSDAEGSSNDRNWNMRWSAPVDLCEPEEGAKRRSDVTSCCVC